MQKYNGIIFTDKESNIVNDHNDPEDVNDNLEITGLACNSENGNTIGETAISQE